MKVGFGVYFRVKRLTYIQSGKKEGRKEGRKKEGRKGGRERRKEGSIVCTRAFLTSCHHYLPPFLLPLLGLKMEEGEEGAEERCRTLQQSTVLLKV